MVRAHEGAIVMLVALSLSHSTLSHRDTLTPRTAGAEE